MDSKHRAVMISRRSLIKAGVFGACSLCLGNKLSAFAEDIYTPESLKGINQGFPVKEAMYYKKLEDLRIECELCPRKCTVADMERGYCGVRENRGGIYYTLVHSRVCALNIDPIEKKPLFHYLPGTKAYSLATAGCNIECKFCQNWQISQYRPEQIDSIKLTPDDIVKDAQTSGSKTIAFTYSEPVVFYEYMYDTSQLARKLGLKSVMISNGYIQEKPLVELCKYLDAVKIDLKGFTEKFYSETCSGELKPVLNTLVALKKIGIWFEIVVLIVPTLNDSEKEIKEMCAWIKNNLGTDVPIHFTRFHPTYKIKNLPPTPVNTIENARQIAIDTGLQFPYVGNVPNHEGENTYCPHCKQVIIRRVGFSILENHIKDGKCKDCSQTISGIWS
ncbi:MAG TPA: AmmeMemoRadiSam system radical SAM enzyme [Candidatus Wujingus californicus]|uniref:AmmeMemoRadiSam system radical SAM enzyme n=2 Tax=Candidatus Wujingus californicus TaxID=3367618 RepID=UPI0027140B47|nr:AmmeMemoRadiSam system radical SAM enzyme [Candidatus Brocadiales bacterium]